MARDAHALAVALELDLGQAGLVEQLGQLADQVVIDRGLACSSARCILLRFRATVQLLPVEHRGKAADRERIAVDPEAAQRALATGAICER